MKKLSLFKSQESCKRGSVVTILWLELPPLEPIELFNTSLLLNADARPAECV